MNSKQREYSKMSYMSGLSMSVMKVDMILLEITSDHKSNQESPYRESNYFIPISMYSVRVVNTYNTDYK